MLEIKEKKEYFVNNKTIEIYSTKNVQTWFSINDLSTLFDRHHLAIKRYIKIVFEKVKITYGQKVQKNEN